MQNNPLRLLVLAMKTKSIAEILYAVSIYPYYKLVLHKFGRYVFMSSGISIEHPTKIDIGDRVVIGRQSALKARSEEKVGIAIGSDTNIAEFVILDAAGGWISIGKRCTINPFSILYGHGGLSIGDDVHIATKATIIPANHYILAGVPLHEQSQSKEGIIIENDVWIGANVSILDGVRIGTGSVVGAGAVVAKDVPSYSIVAGVPAKIVRSRAKNEE